MNKKQKLALYRIILATIFLVVGCIVNINIIKYIMFLAAYVLVGYSVIVKAIKNIINGQFFDENFLMSLATVCAVLIGKYLEAVAVMLFYQIGELFESVATARSRNSIAELMDMSADYATVEKNGELLTIECEEVDIGDIVVVKPGEKVPVDGKIIDGECFVDTSKLTGESVPKKATIGDEVLSGYINLDGVIRFKAEKRSENSTASKIMELVENASMKKAKSEQFITKFAKYYTPIVVIVALIIAIAVPIITKTQFSEWIYRALVFLVVSCPCALVISIPLSFFGGIGCGAKNGVLIKGGNSLEALAKVKTIALDKTGTITKGNFDVSEIFTEDMDKNELLKIVATAQSFSNHPIAKAIKKAYNMPVDESSVDNYKELPGMGIYCTIQGKELYAGNKKLMDSIGINTPDSAYTVVYVYYNEKYAGYIEIKDEIKDESKDLCKCLKKDGVKEIVMLTGDSREIAESVAKTVGIDTVYAQLMPVDKVHKVENFKNKCAFVGDGINDAPVLIAADVGIAMGGIGSDAAVEAADAVIMDDDISKIDTAIKISKKTLKIAKQNIVFAISVKLLVLCLGAFGAANIWDAVLADVGVSVIAILNASRVLTLKKE